MTRLISKSLLEILVPEVQRNALEKKNTNDCI
jgi:hypothetical protein